MKTQATAHSLYMLYESLPREVQRQFMEELLSRKPYELLHPDNKQNSQLPTVTRGDKTIDLTGLFGIWKNAPKNITDLRSKAWQRPELK